MSIEARVAVFRDGTRTETLSPCERLLASYAIAEQSAGRLAESGNVSRGHRAAMHAHLTLLTNREGEKEAAQFMRLLAAMAGLDTRDSGIPLEPEPLDVTDWTSVQIG